MSSATRCCARWRTASAPSSVPRTRWRALAEDEFLVFLENVDKPDVLARKAGEVVSTLHKSYIGPGQNFPLSCSVGISVYPDDGRTVIDLFKSADAAMYASKQHGKDRYSFRE